ncbi:MAG: hypothetical protein AABZ74_00835 [Cyanobacteriota bacterium]
MKINISIFLAILIASCTSLNNTNLNNEKNNSILKENNTKTSDIKQNILPSLNTNNKIEENNNNVVKNTENIFQKQNDILEYEKKFATYYPVPAEKGSGILKIIFKENYKVRYYSLDKLFISNIKEPLKILNNLIETKKILFKSGNDMSLLSQIEIKEIENKSNNEFELNKINGNIEPNKLSIFNVEFRRMDLSKIIDKLKNEPSILSVNFSDDSDGRFITNRSYGILSYYNDYYSNCEKNEPPKEEIKNSFKRPFQIKSDFNLNFPIEYIYFEQSCLDNVQYRSGFYITLDPYKNFLDYKDKMEKLGCYADYLTFTGNCGNYGAVHIRKIVNTPALIPNATASPTSSSIPNGSSGSSSGGSAITTNGTFSSTPTLRDIDDF